jgi:Zn-dependent protease with chaperone function
MERGSATFFDGETAARQSVSVELGATGLVIRAAEGQELAAWPYAELDHLAAPAGVLRLARSGQPRPARLDIHDSSLAHAIDEKSEPVDRTGSTISRERLKVVAWSIGAVASLVALAVFAMPAIADRAAPLVPAALEMRLGAAVEKQIRGSLDRGNRGKPFECGGQASERAGMAAFETMLRKVEAASHLHVPVTAKVVRIDQANAFALPGGHVYVFEGLIKRAEHPDELAGVIAHELGHVANRDGLRSIIQAAGLSFLFGMVLGDFGGGGAVIIASKAVLQSRYSRSVESGADRFAVGVMRELGADPRKLATILLRIAGGDGGGIFVDHPGAQARETAINAAAGSGQTRPILDPAAWAALKTVCAP